MWFAKACLVVAGTHWPLTAGAQVELLSSWVSSAPQIGLTFKPTRLAYISVQTGPICVLFGTRGRGRGHRIEETTCAPDCLPELNNLICFIANSDQTAPDKTVATITRCKTEPKIRIKRYPCLFYCVAGIGLAEMSCRISPARGTLVDLGRVLCQFGTYSWYAVVAGKGVVISIYQHRGLVSGSRMGS